MSTGTPFSEAVVSIPIGGPMSPFAVEYKLRPVFASAVSQSGDGDRSVESVKLAYGAFNQTIGTSSQFGMPNPG